MAIVVIIFFFVCTPSWKTRKIYNWRLYFHNWQFPTMKRWFVIVNLPWSSDECAEEIHKWHVMSERSETNTHLTVAMLVLTERLHSAEWPQSGAHRCHISVKFFCPIKSVARGVAAPPSASSWGKSEVPGSNLGRCFLFFFFLLLILIDFNCLNEIWGSWFESRHFLFFLFSVYF